MIISKKEARRRIAAVEKALRAGHRPRGVGDDLKQPAAIAAAALPLGLARQSLDGSLRAIKREYGLEPDWSLYKPAPKVSETPEAVDKKPSEAPADPLVVRRLADQLAQERAGRREAERAAITAEGLRQGVFNLAATPPAPESWDAGQPEDGRHREVIVLPISDIHMGEVIDIDQMGGRNAYNKSIAAK
jgi:hypothetical protein